MELYHDKLTKLNDEHVLMVREHSSTKEKWVRDLKVIDSAVLSSQTVLREYHSLRNSFD